jgi:hypothetical protein
MAGLKRHESKGAEPEEQDVTLANAAVSASIGIKAPAGSIAGALAMPVPRLPDWVQAHVGPVLPRRYPDVVQRLTS